MAPNRGIIMKATAIITALNMKERIFGLFALTSQTNVKTAFTPVPKKRTERIRYRFIIVRYAASGRNPDKAEKKKIAIYSAETGLGAIVAEGKKVSRHFSGTDNAFITP